MSNNEMHDPQFAQFAADLENARNTEVYEEYEEKDDAPRGHGLLFFLLGILGVVTAFVLWVNLTQPKWFLEWRDSTLAGLNIQNPFAASDDTLIDPESISQETRDADAQICAQLDEMKIVVVRDSITRLGSVVHLDSEKNSDEVMALVGKLTYLNALNAVNANLTDAQTANWVSLTRLTSLNIQDNPLTSASLPNIAKMVNLDGLYLSGNEISGENLEELVKLPHVKIMNIGGTKLTDDDMKVLGQMKSLHWLLIEDLGLTEACLPSFLDMPNLKTLTILKGNQISKEAAKKFEKDFMAKNGTELTVN